MRTFAGFSRLVKWLTGKTLLSVGEPRKGTWRTCTARTPVGPQPNEQTKQNEPNNEFDWIRASDGGPKEMPNGMLVLQKTTGACLAIHPDDLEGLIELAEEAIQWYPDDERTTN